MTIVNMSRGNKSICHGIRVYILCAFADISAIILYFDSDFRECMIFLSSILPVSRTDGLSAESAISCSPVFRNEGPVCQHGS